MHDKLSLALAGVDILYGYSGDGHLSGGAQNDQLYGGDGDDWLDGGTGADFMVGGRHDDTYYVDNAGDVVIEKPDQGFDRVFVKTLASYTLGADVELLEFLQAGTHTGTGNALDNWLRGNFGQDTLYGLGGNDHFEGFSGGDTLIGGEGDDDYAVHPDDVVFELPGQGIDKVRTGLASYTLPDNVENLETYGDIGIGNALDNVIRKQDAGYAELYALEGNDTLYHNWPGDGLVDGRGGDDTAVFTRNLADYRRSGFRHKDRGRRRRGQSRADRDRASAFADSTITLDDGNPLFDTLYYLSRNPDVFHAGVNALDHFNAFGWHEGRDPNAFFDTRAIWRSTGCRGERHQSARSLSPDRLAAGTRSVGQFRHQALPDRTIPTWRRRAIDPLQHFLLFGLAEGRAGLRGDRRQHRRRLRRRVLPAGTIRTSRRPASIRCSTSTPSAGTRGAIRTPGSTPPAIWRTTPTLRRPASTRSSTTSSSAGGKGAIRRRASTRSAIWRPTRTSRRRASIRSITS